MKYVLLGAAGHITSQLAVQLLAANHEVDIVGRSAESLKGLVAQGANAVAGSVEDVAFLTETFTGADAVYTMVPPKWDAANWQGWIAQTGAGYAEAIKLAGVKKVVNLSSVGAHLPQGCGPVSGLYFVEKALNEKSGADVLNLRPSYFYYNLFANIGLIKHMGIMGSNFGGPGLVMPIVDTADIAAAAFNALHNLNFTGTGIQYIASDEVTTDQIAAAIGQAIGKPDLNWVVFTDEQALGGMLQNGLSEEVATNYVELGSAIQSGLMMQDYQQHKPALGKVKLADFAKAFAAAYQAS
jgi:uncharacterized protein YbjT (DUF2867 family)